MTDDTWWAFIAGIDREALMKELPGSVTDRRMREQHAKRVSTYRAPLPLVSDELALERRIELVRSSRAWSDLSRGVLKQQRRSRELDRLEKDLAAYAARKRKKVA